MPPLERLILHRRHKIATSLALLAMTYSMTLMWAYLVPPYLMLNAVKHLNAQWSGGSAGQRPGERPTQTGRADPVGMALRFFCPAASG